MKFKAALLFVLLLFTGRPLGAQSPAADPLAENLFPPELLMQHQSEIGVTEEQRNAIMAEIHKSEDRFAQLNQRLQKEVEALALLLKMERVDEEMALAQFDKLLNQEREIKRAHLSLVLNLKKQLNGAQQAKLRDIKTKIAAEQLRSPQDVQRVLEGKLQKVQEGVQRWQDAGHDPLPIAEMMQEFDPLMKQGKHKEAEALLDRALKRLGESEKEKETKPEKKTDGAAVLKSQKQARNDTTPEALQAKIERLQPARLAWREIAWKTCLLEGLKESREKGKPVLLWIFIDRPTDDGRC